MENNAIPAWVEENGFELPDALALMVEQGMLSIESDDSYALPSFLFDSRSDCNAFSLFVEHPNPVWRVNGPGPERFFLVIEDQSGDQVVQAFADFCDLMDALPEWWKRWNGMEEDEEDGLSLSEEKIAAAFQIVEQLANAKKYGEELDPADIDPDDAEQFCNNLIDMARKIVNTHKEN